MNILTPILLWEVCACEEIIAWFRQNTADTLHLRAAGTVPRHSNRMNASSPLLPFPPAQPPTPPAQSPIQPAQPPLPSGAPRSPIVCPSGFTLGPSGTKCFGVLPPARLDECRARCSALNASLPCVTDSADNGALATLFSRGQVDKPVFIGLFQALLPGKGSTGTRSGWDVANQAAAGCSTDFVRWSRAQPDDRSCVEENCAVMAGPSGDWYDIPCDASMACVCQWPGRTDHLFERYLPVALQRAGERMRPSSGCQALARLGSWSFFGAPLLLLLLFTGCVMRTRHRGRRGRPFRVQVERGAFGGGLQLTAIRPTQYPSNSRYTGSSSGLRSTASDERIAYSPSVGSRSPNVSSAPVVVTAVGIPSGVTVEGHPVRVAEGLAVAPGDMQAAPAVGVPTSPAGSGCAPVIGRRVE